MVMYLVRDYAELQMTRLSRMATARGVIATWPQILQSTRNIGWIADKAKSELIVFSGSQRAAEESHPH